MKVFTNHLVMAFFGGIALIGPTFHYGPKSIIPHQPHHYLCRYFRICTRVGSWAEDGSGKDVLAATAGYAAVLVHFLRQVSRRLQRYLPRLDDDPPRIRHQTAIPLSRFRDIQFISRTRDFKSVNSTNCSLYFHSLF